MRVRFPTTRFWRRSGWLVAEIAVVFLGVYGAFLLDGCRQSQQLERRRVQIASTLCDEAGQVRTNLSQFIAVYDSFYVAPFMRAYHDGERPLPRPLDFFAGSFNAGMWNALLQSGGLDALDHETIARAQIFYGGLENASSYGDAFVQRLNDHVLPRLDEGPAAFYPPEDVDLKPAYRWYPASLQGFSFHLQNLQAAADSLSADLDCPAVLPI